jgi:hypothetical protein
MSYFAVVLLFDERGCTTFSFIASPLKGYNPARPKPPETALVEKELVKSSSNNLGKSIFRIVLRK